MGTKCAGPGIFHSDTCAIIQGHSRETVGLKFHFSCDTPPYWWEVMDPPPPPTISLLDTTDINIYPNPSLDHFNIETTLSVYHKYFIAEIFDLVGRKMLKISLPAGKNIQTISENEWPAGVYLLKISESGKIYREIKIIHIK
jgi:hypothetical protein